MTEQPRFKVGEAVWHKRSRARCVIIKPLLANLYNVYTPWGIRTSIGEDLEPFEQQDPADQPGREDIKWWEDITNDD